MTRKFSQVDVFTDEALLGNPVAVVHDSAGLDAARMQAFTDWTNLSEATFLAPPTSPDADYALRIFSPGQELDFAGHPTLGSCHAWLEAGGQPKGRDVVVQECGVGLVRISRDRATGTLAFAAPPRRRSGPLEQSRQHTLVAALGLDASHVVASQWCDNGPPWQALLLTSAEYVLAVQPDQSLLRGQFIAVVGPQPEGTDTAFEVRAFFPGAGGTVIEDPVTGSLNAALGQWLIGSGRAPERYAAAQGTALGRSGRVLITQADGDIWVGGRCTTVVTGTVAI